MLYIYSLVMTKVNIIQIHWWQKLVRDQLQSQTTIVGFPDLKPMHYQCFGLNITNALLLSHDPLNWFASIYDFIKWHSTISITQETRMRKDNNRWLYVFGVISSNLTSKNDLVRVSSKVCLHLQKGWFEVFYWEV